MMKQIHSTALAVLAAAAVVFANDPIPTEQFTKDNGFGPGHDAALASVPMFHFGRPHGANPCYPEAAHGGTNGDQQTDGNGPDLGNWGKMDNGCAYPGDWNGVMSPGNPFPVYYHINDCGNNQYVITYNIYFKHDSGHKSDWEGVAVVWKNDGSGMSWRDRILLGGHGKYDTVIWGDIQNTVNGYDDGQDMGEQDRNHAKVYVGAFYHKIFHTRYTGIDTANPADPNREFRSNDWYRLPSWQDLVHSTKIKPEWNWGKADSNPATVNDPNNKGKYICERI